MKKYRVAVVGAGAVGEEMIRLLYARDFPLAEAPKVLARSQRVQEIAGHEIQVEETSAEAFQGLDFAFFAGTEGSKGASQVYGWDAVARGCVVIDNGDDFRMDPRVKLIVPEINAEALADHQGFIANPNCSTIIALMAVGPLHKAVGVDRMVVCTYQAVSGTGAAAIQELDEQVRAWATGQTTTPTVYPCPIAFNVIPQIGGAKEVPGVTSEELKLKRETHKILGDARIRVSTTCVRVPVFNGHSEAIHLELKQSLSVAQALEILSQAPGVKIVDDLAQAQFPTPIAASHNYDVLVGRVRVDDSVPHGLALFVAGDNLWKGAAQNAIQIAEALIARGQR